MTEKDRYKAYMHWLFQAAGMGSRGFIRALLALWPPEEIYRLAAGGQLAEKTGKKYLEKARKLEASAAGCDVAGEYERLCGRGIAFVAAGEEEYPKKLAMIPDAPCALYYVGRLPDPDRKTLAVIGARNCSAYGRSMASQFAAFLAEAGVQIVSGMARGVDGIGQQAALDAGGYSLGVLGCGVDICYPPENRELYERLIAQGGICSEYPPGIEPRALLFPPRNRIISGLCDGVLVVEAKERSGTLITVDMALEQGREVYAVPGRVTDPLSRGCNRLIRQGAALVESPEELLRELGLDGGVRGRCQDGGTLLPGGLPGRILKLLDYQPQTTEELLRQYEAAYEPPLSIPELCLELLRLCADGYAEQVGGLYVRSGWRS